MRFWKKKQDRDAAPANLKTICEITIRDQELAGIKYRPDWRECLAGLNFDAVRGKGRAAVLDFIVENMNRWRLPNECRYG